MNSMGTAWERHNCLLRGRLPQIIGLMAKREAVAIRCAQYLLWLENHKK